MDSEDHWITDFPKPENSDNRVFCNTIKTKTRAYKLTKIDKYSEKNIENNKSQKIYASMTRMSSNIDIPRRDIGDSMQLTNWILNPSATCPMAPKISNFVPG